MRINYYSTSFNHSGVYIVYSSHLIEVFLGGETPIFGLKLLSFEAFVGVTYNVH